jgi:hypothetical protein
VAVLAILAAVLTTVVVHADIPAIADDGWRGHALQAAGAGAALLGLALATVVWSATSSRSSGVVARITVILAAVVMTGSVALVGAADEYGGERRAPAPRLLAPREVPPDDPIELNEALDEANLAPAAIAIKDRTSVTIELNRTGRQLFAAAMGCRPSDFLTNRVVGAAVGGTWAEPLLQVASPFNEDGDPVARCQRVLIRLPTVAGTVRPGL